MEILNELPSHKSFPYCMEPSPQYRSAGDLKENSWQSTFFQVMEPQIGMCLPAIKASGTLSEVMSRTSSHVSLAHDVMGQDLRHQFSIEEKERSLPVTTDSLSCHSSVTKLSKRGWMFSTSELSKGKNGCYLSGSHTNSSKRTAAEDPFLQSSSSVQSFSDEFIHPHLNSSLSRTTSTHACSDGSISSEVVGSSEVCHLDQLMDFMFDDNNTIECAMGSLDAWFPESVEFPFTCPVTSQHIANNSHSGSSSDCSNDDGIVQHKREDLTLAPKELGGVSQGKFGSVVQMQSVQDAGLWERQKKVAYGGLEEMFTPSKSVDQEARIFNGIISPFGGSQICFGGTASIGSASENNWQRPFSVQGESVDTGAISFSSKSKQYSKHDRWQKGLFENSSCKFNDHSREEITNKSFDSIAPQTPGPISMDNNLGIHHDSTRFFGLNPIFGSPLAAARSEMDYSEICLVHLLIAGAEAVATRDMDLASVILVRLKELVSCPGSTKQRVAAYFSEGLQCRIEGGHALGYTKAQSDILAAFHILQEISPYIKFGHFTANQAILEAVEREKRVHIVDFEIMEGIQWPPFMQALVLRKGGPPQLRITALIRPHADHGLATVHETGKRLSEFASSLNLPFIFSLVRVSNEEEFSVSSVKLIKGEALVVNCMLHLPHMPHRTATSVLSFLQGMRRLSPIVLTLVEEELGCSTTAVAAYFFEALHHYAAICDSLEACLSTETVARMLVERVFLAPRINSAVMFGGGSSAQSELGADFATYNWCSLVRSVGFKSLPLSFQNLSQARLLLGLYKDGFKMEERSNRLLLGWRAKPLFAASVWN